MPTPDDATDVIKTIRLGWAMSEFRGRHRPRITFKPARIPDEWPTHALPLTEERSPAELETEVEKVLVDLSEELALDPDCPTDPPSHPVQKYSDLASTKAAAVRDLARRWAERPPGAPSDPKLEAEQDEAFDALAEVLYKWDASIQDQLAIQSVNQLTAYDLGRALADSYWALDPTAGSTIATSWQRLLEGDRRSLIDEYLGRLSAYFDALTPPAVSGSLATWSSVATTPAWRADVADTRAKLHEQVRRWYGLLVLGQSPQTYLNPLALLRNWRATRTAVRAFLPDLVMLVLGLAAATGLVTLIQVGYGASWLKWLLGFAGTLGLSSAAITTRLKSASKNLLSRLTSEVDSDAVAIGVTIVPDQKPAKSILPGSKQRAVTRAVGQAIRTRGVEAAT